MVGGTKGKSKTLISMDRDHGVKLEVDTGKSITKRIDRFGKPEKRNELRVIKEVSSQTSTWGKRETGPVETFFRSSGSVPEYLS